MHMSVGGCLELRSHELARAGRSHVYLLGIGDGEELPSLGYRERECRLIAGNMTAKASKFRTSWPMTYLTIGSSALRRWSRRCLSSSAPHVHIACKQSPKNLK
jgi:hypothetical protein